MDTVLLVLLVLYAVGLVTVAVVANSHKRTETADGASSGHFGGTFSTGALILTTASTIFSGATVAGIPAEVGRIGYMSFRWFGAMFGIVASMLLIFPRLRRCATTRGYKSPNDFIADRYRSRRLRMMTTLCASCGAVIYLTIQFNAFGFEFRALFGGELWMGMTVFGVVVLLMEKLGGMKSVVYTDMIQATIMVCCFSLLPFILWAKYGSFSSLVDQCKTVEWKPGDLSTTQNRSTGCIKDVAPTLLEYPSLESAVNNVFWFSFSMIAFPLNLHLVQRCYIAKSDASLRIVMIALVLSALVCYPAGIYMGVVATAYKDDLPGTPSAFANVVTDLQEVGFFHNVFTSTLHCCFLAAIMSTADSLMMGVSANISMDVFKGLLTPDISEETVVFAAEMCSVGQCILGVLIGNTITPVNYGTILGLSNGFLFQIAPAYILGLWTSVSTRAVTCGIAAGMITSILCYFFLDVDTIVFETTIPGTLNRHMPDPMIGLALNVTVLALVQLIAPGDDQRFGDQMIHQRFGERLTPEKINLALAQSYLPPLWTSFCGMGLLLVSTPMWEEQGRSQLIVFGMPHFAYVMFIMSMLAGLCVLYGAIQWAPVDERSGLLDNAASAQTELSTPSAGNAVPPTGSFEMPQA